MEPECNMDSEIAELIQIAFYLNVDWRYVIDAKSIS